MSPFIEAMIVEFFKRHFTEECILIFVHLYAQDKQEAKEHFFDIWQAFKFDCIENGLYFDEIEILSLFENNGVPFKNIWEPIIITDDDIRQFASWKILNERQYPAEDTQDEEAKIPTEEIQQKEKQTEELRSLIYNYFSDVASISLSQMSRMEMQFDMQLKKLIATLEEKGIATDTPLLKQMIGNLFRGLPAYLFRSVDRYQDRIQRIKPKKTVKKVIKVKAQQPVKTFELPEMELPPPLDSNTDFTPSPQLPEPKEIEPLELIIEPITSPEMVEGLECIDVETEMEAPEEPMRNFEVRQVKLQKPTEPAKPETAEKKVEVTQIKPSEDSIRALINEQIPLFTDTQSFYWKLREMINNLRTQCASDKERVFLLLCINKLRKQMAIELKQFADKKSHDCKMLQNAEYALQFHETVLANAIPPHLVSAAKTTARG